MKAGGRFSVIEELPERYFYHKNKVVKIGQILKEIFPKRGGKGERVYHRVREAWKCVVDDEVYRGAHIVNFKNGILYISVESAVMTHYLTNFKKTAIITGLNEKIGEKYIEDIRFKVGISDENGRG
ncbi:MAG: DUF721 domain-containing protein [wastewater metagenome]|nr:DUF721 domain-containing protein [Candidatus Loosdrechtia aerotolerans]